MYGLLKVCTVNDLSADSVLLLAQDVKVMLQTLRKYRRQWLWLAKKANVEWPPVASKYPHCINVNKDMTGEPGKREDDEEQEDEAIADANSEAQELAAMWAVPQSIEEQVPDSIEKQILTKRRIALEELQKGSVLLEGSSGEEQPPEAARGSSDPAPVTDPTPAAPTLPVSGPRDPDASAKIATWQHLC